MFMHRLHTPLAGAGWALLLGAGLLPAAVAQEKPAPEPLPRQLIESGRDVGGDAYQRLVDTKSGRYGVASTAPAFSPRTGERLSGALVRHEDGSYRVDQGSLTLEIAGSTTGKGSALHFGKTEALRVSPAVRLFGQSEQGSRFDLVARGVDGVPGDDGVVRYPGAFEAGELLHVVRPGGLATELVLPSVPEPLRTGVGYETVWFEEVLRLPYGWRVQGLEVGSTLRSIVGLPIVDGEGKTRARIDAPLVFEQRTPKDAPEHFARVFAELTAQPGGVVTYRVAIPAAWLTDAARSYPVVIDPFITEAQPIAIAQSSTIDIAARSGWWNAVGISAAASTDWDLSFGSAYSLRFPPNTDFVVANGNRGAVSPQTGDATRFSGTATGIVEHAGIDNITMGDNVDLTWPGGHVVHLLEVYVGTTGSQQVTINGPAGFGWALFAPGTTAAWKSRSSADYDFAVSTQARSVNFHETGFWALVLFKDGGAGPDANLTVRWQSQATFNLEATSIALDAPAYPVTLQAGDMFDFTRNITRVGTLPTGAQIDYSVHLSLDSTITLADPEVWSYQNAGTGVLSLTGFIPSNIPDGTYFVGMRVEVVPGESNTNDNQAFDAVTSHRVVIQSAPPAPTVVQIPQGGSAAVTAAPSDLSATPNQSVWNLVALQGNDWNLTLGGVSSSQTGSAIDYVVANGNNGAIASPVTGTATRVSGTGSASAVHTASALIGATGVRTFAWTAGKFAHVFAHEVSQTGSYEVEVQGVSGASWALFAPGANANWQARTAAFASGQVGQTSTVNLSQAGWWALVVVKDGAAATAGTLDLRMQPVVVPPATFNAAVTQASVQSVIQGPVQLSHGDPLTVARTIDVTGTLPQGSAIDYSIVLSLDQVVDANDFVLHRFTGAAQGSASITETIPATVAPGTYFVAVAVDAIAGETSATDNVLFATLQVEVMPPITIMMNVIASDVTAVGAPLTILPGDSFDVDVDITVTSVPVGTTPLTYKIYLSSDSTITAADVEVFSGTGTTGQATHTVTLPATATISSGTHFLGLIIDPVAGETSTADNTVASATAEVTVQAAPPASLALVVDQPQVIGPQYTPFTFAPVQGAWNAIGIVAMDPADDFDVFVGNSASMRLDPDCDFVVANGHAGTIIDTAGEFDPWFAVDDARVVHAQATALTFGQSGSVAWGLGPVTMAEVAIPAAGAQSAIIDGPAGLKVAFFEPGTSGVFVSRDDAAFELDLGPQPQALALSSAGVWGLAFFAEAGVNPAPGQITIQWSGAASQGFDLAAAHVAIAGGLQVAAGGTIDVAWLVANLGVDASPAYVYAIYLVAGQTLDPAVDVKVFEATAQPALAGGATASDVTTVTLPAQVASGTYRLGLHVPHLAQDTVAGNDTIVSQETVAVTGGSTNPTSPGVIARRSGGGGGGCSLDAGDGAPATPWALLLLAFGLAAVRRRRFAIA